MHTFQDITYRKLLEVNLTPCKLGAFGQRFALKGLNIYLILKIYRTIGK